MEQSEESKDKNSNMDAEPLDVPPELVEAYLFRLPRSYFYEDYIWPGLLMSPRRLELVRKIEFRSTDILIASYPKSGTTWVSEVVSLICHGGDVDKVCRKPLHERVPWLEMDNNHVWVQAFWIWQVFSKLLGYSAANDGEAVEEEESVPRVFFTHLPLELLPEQVHQGGCRLIYISRNPKDNAVSFFHFHQMARFLGQQKTTWDEFFALYTVGKIYCGSWFEHVLGFWQFSRVLRDKVFFLKYEDMKKDLLGEVRKLAEFLSIPLSEEACHSVVEHCQFSSMKDNKMANRDGVWLFNQKVSKFMRKGIVGDWKNYFTVAQSELFDELFASKMKDSGLSYRFQLTNSKS